MITVYEHSSVHAEKASTDHEDTIHKGYSPDRQRGEQRWQIIVAREGLLEKRTLVLSVGGP